MSDTIETQTETLAEPASTPAEPTHAERGGSMGRLIGVDLARALAVFGMFVVHVGPRTKEDMLDGWFLQLADGHASVLFATLAGFSLMLIAGRREPRTGLAGRQARMRIVIRAVILFVLGSALVLAAGDIVILNYYGIYFLLALPLLRLRAKALAIIAAVFAVVGPIVSVAIKTSLTPALLTALTAGDPLERFNGQGFLDLFVTGLYPVLTWMPFIIGGMALGRLDLDSVKVQRRLAALGTGLVVFAYGIPLIASRYVPAFNDAFGGPVGEFKEFTKESFKNLTPSEKLLDGAQWGWSMLGAEPHSGTILDVLGSFGVAVLVLVASTALIARVPLAATWLKPVIAVGTMSLTIYVAHLLALSFVMASVQALVGFIVVAIVFATLWSRFFAKGPLEYLVNRATQVGTRKGTRA